MEKTNVSEKEITVLNFIYEDREVYVGYIPVVRGTDREERRLMAEDFLERIVEMVKTTRPEAAEKEIAIYPVTVWEDEIELMMLMHANTNFFLSL
jgi:hypothetical protein